MNETLFDYDHSSDPLRIAKSFFNSLFDISFLKSINYLVNRTSVVSEYHGCTFPENIDPDEEPFVGVKFRRIDEEIIVEEEIFLSLLKETCERYLDRVPEKEAEVKDLLARIQKSRIHLLEAKARDTTP